jgi:hypothetical protein
MYMGGCGMKTSCVQKASNEFDDEAQKIIK